MFRVLMEHLNWSSDSSNKGKKALAPEKHAVGVLSYRQSGEKRLGYSESHCTSGCSFPWRQRMTSEEFEVHGAIVTLLQLADQIIRWRRTKVKDHTNTHTGWWWLMPLTDRHHRRRNKFLREEREIGKDMLSWNVWVEYWWDAAAEIWCLEQSGLNTKTPVIYVDDNWSHDSG